MKKKYYCCFFFILLMFLIGFIGSLNIATASVGQLDLIHTNIGADPHGLVIYSPSGTNNFMWELDDTKSLENTEYNLLKLSGDYGYTLNQYAVSQFYFDDIRETTYVFNEPRKTYYNDDFDITEGELSQLGNLGEVDGNYTIISATDFRDEYYPATFTFLNDTNGNIENWNSNWNILDDLDGHHKIMYRFGTAGCSQNFAAAGFDNQTKGTIEFYWRFARNDRDTQFNLRARNSNGQDFQRAWNFMVRGGNFVICNHPPTWNWRQLQTPTAAAINTWYHIRVDFDLNKVPDYAPNSQQGDLGAVNITINGELKEENGQMKDGGENGWQYIHQISYHDYQSGQTQYIDAVGYSWDPDYEIGDNLNKVDSVNSEMNIFNTIMVDQVDDFEDLILIYNFNATNQVPVNFSVYNHKLNQFDIINITTGQFHTNNFTLNNSYVNNDNEIIVNFQGNENKDFQLEIDTLNVGLMGEIKDSYNTMSMWYYLYNKDNPDPLDTPSGSDYSQDGLIGRFVCVFLVNKTHLVDFTIKYQEWMPGWLGAASPIAAFQDSMDLELIENIEFNFHIRMGDYQGEFGALSRLEYILNQNTSYIQRFDNFTKIEGESVGYLHFLECNYLDSRNIDTAFDIDIGYEFRNKNPSLKFLRFMAPQQTAGLIQVPLITEDADISVPRPDAPDPSDPHDFDEDLPDAPDPLSDHYWTYEVFFWDTHYIKQLTVGVDADFLEEWTVDFEVLSMSPLEVPWYYDPAPIRHIRGSDLGSWTLRIDFGDFGEFSWSFRWLRNGVRDAINIFIDLLNNVLVFAWWLVFLMWGSMSFFFSFIAIWFIISIWNFLGEFWITLFYWGLWLVVFALVSLLYLLELIFEWFMKEILPNILTWLISLMSWLIAFILWAFTGFQGDLALIQANVEEFLWLITNTLFEAIIVFAANIPAILAYATAYLTNLGLIFVSYIYSKSRGYIKLSERFYACFEAFMFPVHISLAIILKLKEILFGWL